MKDSLDFTDISILYLCSRKIFLYKIDRVRFHAVQAISKLCHVVWSGPDWENWDNAKSLKENVAILYKDKKRPDLIFCYQPFLIKGFSEIDIPTCHSYNEMGTVEQPRSYTVKEIVENKIDLVIAHHRNEMSYPEFKDLPCKIVNISHCVEKTIYKDYQLKKNTAVLLVGQIHHQRYPLRYKLSKMILKMREEKRFYPYIINILQHPGARLNDAHTDREAIRFAKSINSSKICLTCSGIYRSRYAKYVEVPACRSLLMADLPDEDHDFFKQFMAIIDLEDSYEKITEKILYYLENDDERNKMTDLGYELTQKNYTHENYAVRFLTAVDDYLKEYGHKKLPTWQK